ncbi:MAG: tetratricopeptide repeat protein [Acidobacteria bacterium]|nr:tetratricopeptide repeat protein [Acidobacteriota bacterium]
MVRVPISPEDIARANELIKEGDLAFERKETYAALIKYIEARSLNPYSEYLYNRMGIAFSQLGYYSDASQAFRQAMEINPKYPYPYNNLGSVLFAQQYYKRAEKQFKKAIALKADEASFHMNLGSLYLEKKKYDKAMAEWRKSLALDPNIFSRPSAVSLSSAGSSLKEKNYFIARLFARAGNTEAAIENLKLAITNGFTDIKAIGKNPDFDPIRNDERFIEFLKNAELLIKLQSNVGLPVNPSNPQVR